MDSVSSFFQWENDENGDSKEGQSHIPHSTSSLSFDFNSFFNPNSSEGKQSTSTNQSESTSQQNKNSSTPSKPSSSSTHNTLTVGGSSKPSSSPANAKQKQQSYMSQQLTDKLIEKLFSIALPPSNEMSADSLEGRVQAGKLRPGLSVPIMSRNFIQLNSRLSFPFESIDNIIKFFNWENPKLTLTILVIYTHLVLRPLPMMLSIPFFLIVIYIMAPAYATRHQPEYHSIIGKSNPVLAEGPQLKEYEIPKPSPEISREFILNLTDLQNHMLLYVIAWDFINDSFAKFAYFVDESISSFFFLTFLISGVFTMLFIETIWQFIPIKFLLISFGWGFTIVFHPYFKDYVFHLVYSEETRYYLLNKTNKFEQILEQNFDFIEPQEQREVEIFEIQRFDKEEKEWHFLFYLNNDFAKLSKPRLDKKYANMEIIGTTSLSKVNPPKDWEFIENDQWKIDLNPDTWVSNHLLKHVVKVDNETKWVYDLDDNQDSKGEFRRRRWTRSVTRFSEIEYEKKKNEDQGHQHHHNNHHQRPATSPSLSYHDDKSASMAPVSPTSFEFK